jgi:hypothetical protein
MKAITILLPLFSAATMFAATPQAVIQPFEAGQMYQEPERDSPPATSRMFVRKIDANSVRNGVSLPATGNGGMIILLLPMTSGGGTDRGMATLHTPTGDALNATDRGSSARGLQRFAVDAAEGLGITVPSGDQEVIHVENTAAGLYTLRDIRMPSDAAGMLVVAGEPESNLTMTTVAGPMSRMAGQPLTLRATLNDGTDAVVGSHVTATLAPADGATVAMDVELFDDGAHGDGAKNDGVYAATVAELPSARTGFWRVRYEASGTNAAGVEFARTGSSEFMNERASARLDADGVNARIVGDMVRVSSDVDVAIAGQYRYDVIVASRADARGERRGIAAGQEVHTLTTGDTKLALDFPLAMLGAKPEELFLDVRLLSLDVMGVAGRVTIEPVIEKPVREATGRPLGAAQP